MHYEEEAFVEEELDMYSWFGDEEYQSGLGTNSLEDEEEEDEDDHLMYITNQRLDWNQLDGINLNDYKQRYSVDFDISTQGIPLRASTAPARPLTEIEEFWRSNEFSLLEGIVLLCNKLIWRSDEKYDLDSSEG